MSITPIPNASAPAISVRLLAAVFCAIAIFGRPAPRRGAASVRGLVQHLPWVLPHVGSGSCEYEDGVIGGNSCTDAPFEHDGNKFCLCGPGGGVCGIPMADAQRKAVERDALDLVARGGTLSADGLFYLAFLGHRQFLRRKCDGALVDEVVPHERIDSKTRAG